MKTDTYVPFEQQYRNNVLKVLRTGVPCDAERTGTGTRMKTGLGYRIDLQKEFPILSTKKMAIDKIAAENVWFISGSTDNTDLNRLGTKIWNEWEDVTGQLGPLYGAMWRRRPATNIRYEEHAPIEGYFKHHKVTANFLKTKCRKKANLTGIVCTKMAQRVTSIHALWYEMMEDAVKTGATVCKEWLEFDTFLQQFPRLAGNELLHLATDKTDLVTAKKLVVTNAQGPHNTYCLDTSCVVPQYLANEFPRKEIKQKGFGTTYLCPVFYIDQLGEAIDALKDHSQSRRIVIDCWDPSLLPVDGLSPSRQPELGLQSLAPCHPLFQFNVVPAHQGKPAQLDVCVYMRSQDMFLGTPYNIAGYALITHMVAKVTGLQPGILTMTGGNCHIYADHVKQVQRQSRRKIRPMVQLKPLPDVARIEDFKVEHFQLEGYDPAGPLKAPVAV